jgi:hypothetical protein
LFPLIRPLPLPGAGGPVGHLFPVINPSPGAGGAASPFPSIRPSSRLAAADRTSARTTAADDSMPADLPLGGGQAAALFFLAVAAALTGLARFRKRRG